MSAIIRTRKKIDRVEFILGESAIRTAIETYVRLQAADLSAHQMTCIQFHGDAVPEGLGASIIFETEFDPT